MSKNVSTGGGAPARPRPENPMERHNEATVARLRGMIVRLELEEYDKITIHMAIAKIEWLDRLLREGKVQL